MDKSNRDVLGVPEITPKLNHLLGRLRTQQTVILIAVIYYNKRIQSKGKRCMGPSPGETRHRLAESSPGESH